MKDTYKEGFDDGYGAGEQIGYDRGDQDGYSRGEYNMLKKLVEKKWQGGKDAGTIAEELETERELVERIISQIEEH